LLRNLAINRSGFQPIQEKEAGALYDWIRDVWRQGFDIGVHTLQEAIIPKDLDMFEQYWIDQFSTLLNLTGNEVPKEDSKVGQQVRAALQAQLRLTKRAT
jgi:hypothetical protein